MSKRSSEQRSYSVDEMMERLRDSEREKQAQEESELVTRPDGTQVVRVRRKKRRSEQPQKTKKTRRMRLGWIAAALVVVLLIGLIGTGALLLARYNSKGFRDGLKEGIADSIGANVSLADMVVTPKRVRADAVVLTWRGGGIPKYLKLRGVAAGLQLGTFVGGTLRGEELTARSGELLLGPPDFNESASNPAMGKFPVEFSQYRTSNFQVVYGEDIDDPVVRLSGAEVTSRGMEGGGVQLLIKGGRLFLSGWDELRVERGTVELKNGKVSIVSLRASPTPRSEEAASGSVLFRTRKPARGDRPFEADVEVEELPLSFLVGSGLGQLLTGNISGEKGRVAGDPRYLDSLDARIEFEGSGGALSGFSFLEGLRATLGDAFYSRPDIGKIKGIYRRDAEGSKIQNFEFEAKAKLIVRGDISLGKDRALGGKLEVGIPQGLNVTPRGAKRWAVFSDPKYGYCWVTVELSGTIDRPQDNFTTMLAEAAQKAPGIRNRDQELEDQFDRLTE